MPHIKVSVVARTLAAEAAHAAAGAAMAEAERLGVRVNVALVDAGGVLAAFLRMPGAPLHSVDIAIDKAYTAASFGLPTSRWSEILQGHSAAVRAGLPLRPRFVAFGGGLPVLDEGAVVGGIGVSGASEEQDEAIARAGLMALGSRREEA
jgi:uncharacterized protein GlcG (DUF336 family)